MSAPTNDNTAPEAPATGTAAWYDLQIAAAQAQLDHLQGQVALSPVYQAAIRAQGKVEALQEMRAALEAAE